MTDNFNKAPKCQYQGVPEGDDFDFNAEEIHMAYCDKLIQLYQNDDEEPLEYEHFIKPFEDQHPKTSFALFDVQLIDNLNKMDITIMRPAQIASMMATLFASPDQTKRTPDLLCVSSTGSGKTLAFLVPMIQMCMEQIQKLPSNTHRTPMVLIFAHTITLVANIYQTAEKLVQGTDVKISLIAGKTKFIDDTYFDIGICTIGRFKNHFGDPENGCIQIDMSALKCLIVDEADVMVIEPEFRKIVNELKNQVDFSTFCYSATINHVLYHWADQNNYYAFGGGSVNRVAASVKTAFWEVDTKCNSRITGIYNGKINVGSYEKHERQHPFDCLYRFIRKY
uniref:ATP-dependent RNA helicase n=1 Tax=Panagrolaimus sp. PS1159 TaxID=55785 RepID=A0AC35GA21_9BILA